MANQPPQKAQALPNPYGLPNPYAQKGLPNPYASATISAAPVKYTEEQAKAEQQKKPAFHNPHQIKRPQAKKAVPTVKRATMPVAAPLSSSVPGPANLQQHGIDYYRSTAEDDASILEERRMRAYEEKQRKKEHKKFTKMYGLHEPLAAHKPDKPSNLLAYKAQGGYRRKKEGFTAFLRGAAAQHKSRGGSEEASGTPSASSSGSTPATVATKPSFAPPAYYDDSSAAPSSDPSGEDAYTRRMRLSQQQSDTAPPPPPSVTDDYVPPPPPPPPADSPPAPPSYQGATISAPPVRYATATISAPPVRYERPDVQMEDADNEPAHDERPAKRAKISKAEAMMNKMGYKKGQGLGKNNDGVVTHLEVKKRRVLQGAGNLDANGRVQSQQVWDVSGGMRIQKDEPSKFGDKSSVVVTWGCVDGVDWDANAERNDGGIRQDMGEAFGKKFGGDVERIQLDENNKDGVVYIQFNSPMAALNAVNRFDEGWEFRGRKIRAQYYDERKFHSGIYDY